MMTSEVLASIRHGAERDYGGSPVIALIAEHERAIALLQGVSERLYTGGFGTESQALMDAVREFLGEG